jgi:hypothetical protein
MILTSSVFGIKVLPLSRAVYLSIVRRRVLLTSRPFASHGSTRLHQTAVTFYAGHHVPTCPNSVSFKNRRHPETDITADECAGALHKDMGKEETLAVVFLGVTRLIQKLVLEYSDR